MSSSTLNSPKLEAPRKHAPAQNGEPRRGTDKAVKILQIGNYPPPMCGWAIQTKLVTDELRGRGHICEVLKINENRQLKDPAYIDVQGGWDYLYKVVRHALAGYRLNVHLNGMSKKGFILALIAVVAGRLVLRPTLVTFHGGLGQEYFPRHDSWKWHQAFRILFVLAGKIACDSDEIKRTIAGYGIPEQKISSIATFSNQYVDFSQVQLGSEIETFLQRKQPVIFSYVSFRPEYRLELVRECMSMYRKSYPNAGFIWLGFPEKEMAAARAYVEQWPKDEQTALLLLGNLMHDEFLTLLSRCHIYLRTPACDGVAASVLESLVLATPVVASENGRRPSGVITYADEDVADMCSKLEYATEHQSELRSQAGVEKLEDNVAKMADWLLAENHA